MEKQGIDVSRYQGLIDWPAVAAAKKRFAIVRAGYGRRAAQQDPYFVRNAENAAAAGLAVGCYWYSYADSVAAAEAEAEACLAVVGQRAMPLGIWFNQEYEPAILALSNAERTAIAQTFLARIRAAGFTAGLYCSADWLQNRLNTAAFAEENLWIAQYASSKTSPIPPCIWQYSSTGLVNGIAGNTDLDLLYKLPAPTPSP